MALFVGLGWGSAAQTFVGQNLGARKEQRAAQSGWLAALYNLAAMAILVLLYRRFGEPHREVLRRRHTRRDGGARISQCRRSELRGARPRHRARQRHDRSGGDTRDDVHRPRRHLRFSTSIRAGATAFGRASEMRLWLVVAATNCLQRRRVRRELSQRHVSCNAPFTALPELDCFLRTLRIAPEGPSDGVRDAQPTQTLHLSSEPRRRCGDVGLSSLRGCEAVLGADFDDYRRDDSHDGSARDAGASQGWRRQQGQGAHAGPEVAAAAEAQAPVARGHGRRGHRGGTTGTGGAGTGGSTGTGGSEHRRKRRRRSTGKLWRGRRSTGGQRRRSRRQRCLRLKRGVRSGTGRRWAAAVFRRATRRCPISDTAPPPPPRDGGTNGGMCTPDEVHPIATCGNCGLVPADLQRARRVGSRRSAARSRPPAHPGSTREPRVRHGRYAGCHLHDQLHLVARGSACLRLARLDRWTSQPCSLCGTANTHLPDDRGRRGMGTLFGVHRSRCLRRGNQRGSDVRQMRHAIAGVQPLVRLGRLGRVRGRRRMRRRAARRDAQLRDPSSHHRARQTDANLRRPCNWGPTACASEPGAGRQNSPPRRRPTAAGPAVAERRARRRGILLVKSK